MRNILSVVLILTWLASSGQSNLQSYTPSILFGKGDWEIKSFQNLYLQSKSFNSGGRKVKDQFKKTFFTNTNQFLYGLNDQINVGFDLWIKASNQEGDAFSTSSGISGFGPKIKIAPLKSVPRLSIQSTFLLNTLKDPEGREGTRYFLDFDANLWITQVFFDLPLNERSQLFFQQAFWYRMVRESFAENNFLDTQTSVFYSYFPSSRWTVYAMSEFFPRHYNANDGAQEASAFYEYFVQSGLGFKYQLIPNFIEIEALYTNFWRGSEATGAGETINLGIRVIHQ